MKNLFLLLSLFSIHFVKAQSYPSFGPPVDVTITGLSFDAMEPFISQDGQYLFFNNLNDGITTKLYYATYVNDSTFNFVGELSGTNQTVEPYLDAVPDMDALGNFYWTSTRQYPAEMENVYHGNFAAGNVADSARLHGDFYILIPGWLIMDHGISPNGDFLYYNNARFDGGAAPVETKIGIAEKLNDTTFNTIPTSTTIMAEINDTNFIFYAPCITADELEFYYTRFPKGPITAATTFDICVAVRDTDTDPFSAPLVLFSETIGNLVEAPTLTADKQIMYYHRKEDGTHRIKMRRRLVFTEVENFDENSTSIISAKGKLTIESETAIDGVKIISINGQVMASYSNLNATNFEIITDEFSTGIYLVEVLSTNKKVVRKKVNF